MLRKLLFFFFGVAFACAGVVAAQAAATPDQEEEVLVKSLVDGAVADAHADFKRGLEGVVLPTTHKWVEAVGHAHGNAIVEAVLESMDELLFGTLSVHDLERELPRVALPPNDASTKAIANAKARAITVLRWSLSGRDFTRAQVNKAVEDFKGQADELTAEVVKRQIDRIEGGSAKSR